MRVLLLIAVLLLAACQSTPSLPQWQSPEGREHADLGRIIDLRSGRQLTPNQLLDELAPAERVLVGERHDNPDHHALQLWLLEALAQRRAQGSLLLEMLEPAQQPKVETVKAAIAGGQRPADLPTALDWDKGWPWALYGPLVEHALAQPMALLNANLDGAEVSSIYREKPQVTGRPAAAAVQDKLFAQIRDSHCDMLAPSQMPAMLAVQQQRDRRMAERLDEAPKPAMLLAGIFHVRRDLGAPLHLAAPDKGNRVLILAEVGETFGAQQADFVWFTPAQAPKDHCATFRKRR
jgi:uncharacterized iron-regulated protein